jgi:hypothetical protein
MVGEPFGRLGTLMIRSVPLELAPVDGKQEVLETSCMRGNGTPPRLGLLRWGTILAAWGSAFFFRPWP